MKWPAFRRAVPPQPPSSTERIEELAEQIKQLADEIASATQALRGKRLINER